MTTAMTTAMMTLAMKSSSTDDYSSEPEVEMNLPTSSEEELLI
jgi:hypothetical protein